MPPLVGLKTCLLSMRIRNLPAIVITAAAMASSVRFVRSSRQSDSPEISALRALDPNDDPVRDTRSPIHCVARTAPLALERSRRGFLQEVRSAGLKACTTCRRRAGTRREAADTGPRAGGS